MKGMIKLNSRAKRNRRNSIQPVTQIHLGMADLMFESFELPPVHRETVNVLYK